MSENFKHLLIDVCIESSVATRQQCKRIKSHGDHLRGTAIESCSGADGPCWNNHHEYYNDGGYFINGGIPL